MDQHFDVSLPDELAAHVRAKVASGEYATESEVIRDGLRALRDRDHALEKWLRTEAVAALNGLEADPSSGRSLEQLRERLAATRKRLEANDRK